MARKRWVYDFERGGKRYCGYCLDDDGTPVTSHAAAVEYQEHLRRQIPRRATGSLKNFAPDTGYVYFCASADGRRVKIGHSRKPTKRLKALQTGSPERLRLIGKLPGSRAFERLLHDKFEPHHLYGEWYRLEPDILQFIADASPKGRTSVPDGGETKAAA